ncbi:hypothetical protein OO007_18345 [Cocleimonas sp. KMM 6892]|uniref:hypothetical protein n=1 Tax=unclassified Cocleimonas TaxID=2639732 RepID=UPI002DBDD60D|nr:MULTISPECIES: hypothetical protein [unclassified Cocleimonas]MEB8434203.1 hypothetical protein [Cocleimonas sp. KMM 6892]MEC4717178.1 hypothetical protein [Cocleimonas sp. KMM 6895]MEC4746475.1 hypothetical protein [Cocleimonas sp. KMM 6896]
MNRYIKIKKIAVGVIASLLLLSTQSFAAQQGHLKVTSKAQKMIVVNNNGQKAYKFVPATKILPGELVQYNTYFQNIGNQPANNINIVNPIPKHTVYLPNSAQGKNTNIVFSVDGGKHYGKAGTLKVRDKTGKIVPARPSDYTHIQWRYNGNLAPNVQQAVAFRVRLL